MGMGRAVGSDPIPDALPREFRPMPRFLLRPHRHPIVDGLALPGITASFRRRRVGRNRKPPIPGGTGVGSLRFDSISRSTPSFAYCATPLASVLAPKAPSLSRQRSPRRRCVPQFTRDTPFALPGPGGPAANRRFGIGERARSVLRRNELRSIPVETLWLLG